MNLKWTNGLPYERSKRNDAYKIQSPQSQNNNAIINALNHDETTWEILNQGNIFKVSNKREELGNRLATRDMVQQIGFNPFLGETNYIEDVSNRDKFLKPMNTTEN